MNKLNIALSAVKSVCDEWNTLKEARSGRGGWLFNYKLYDLSSKCEDANEFDLLAGLIFNDWQEAAQEAAGYVPETWNYNKYFEHDKHHGSYFSFRERIEGGGSLDFWANNVGLEWDSTSGVAWAFTPFEKAIYDCYGTTRFSTDRLTPEEYTQEEITEITEYLTVHVLPALLETLTERKAVIAAYDDLKAHQLQYN
jgi:hypothetical protein